MEERERIYLSKCRKLFRFLSESFSVVVGRKVSVNEYIGSTSRVAFTLEPDNNKAKIFINPFNDLFDGLNENQKLLSLYGLAIHEAMHQIMTNFYEINKMAKKFSSACDPHIYIRDGLFREICNVFEDSRIEYWAPTFFGGLSLKGLKFIIGRTFEKSFEICPTMRGMDQVITALIQIGDGGKYKGSLSPEARECLKKVLPLFSQCIVETNGKKAVAIEFEAAKIIAQSFPESKDETTGWAREYADQMHKSSGLKSMPEKIVADEATMKKIERALSEIINDMDIDADVDTSDGAEDTGDTSLSEDCGKDDSKSSCSSLSKDDPSKSKPKAKKTKGKGKEEPIKKTIDDDTSEAEAEMAKVMDEIKDTSILSDKKTKEKEAPIPDFGDEGVVNHACYHTGTDECDYKNLEEKNMTIINRLGKNLEKAVLTEMGYKECSLNGQVNLLRYKNPGYTGNKIFDKRYLERERSASIMLLVDCSGSMSCGNRSQYCKEFAVILSKACGIAGIPFSCIGYTGDIKYGNDTTDNFWLVPWTNTVTDRYNLAHIRPISENRDGETYRYAGKCMDKRPEKNKIIIILTDGSPAANHYLGTPAINDTKAAIAQLRKKNKVIGVCINKEDEYNISNIYDHKDFVSLDDLDDMNTVLIKKIKQLATAF